MRMLSKEFFVRLRLKEEAGIEYTVYRGRIVKCLNYVFLLIVVKSMCTEVWKS